MSKALQIAPLNRWTTDQIALIKRTVCKGATNDELALFLHVAMSRELDPFTNQIHAVKRWDSTQRKEVMAIQVGIDGLRAIADRTGNYTPGRAPLFQEENGQLISATAFVKKFVHGQWHEVPGVAHYREYVALKKDGNPNHMWASKPHIMLAKCAEAKALRKAFPSQLSGLYTHEEMEQADNPPAQTGEVGTVHRGVIAKTSEKKGRGKNKWVLTFVEIQDGAKFQTFSTTLGKQAAELIGYEVEIAFKVEKGSLVIQEIRPVESTSELIEGELNKLAEARLPQADEIPPPTDDDIPF